VSNRLALGTVQFGLRYGVANRSAQITQQAAASILSHAWAAGLTTLDTAITYGDSEQRLGEAGVGHWQVVTKLPELPNPCRDVTAWVRESADGSLRRLRIPRLHGLLLHRSKDLLGPEGATLWRALTALKDAGTVQKIGVSIYDPAELEQIWQRFRPDLVQAPFSIFDRRIATSGWLTRLHAAHTEIHVRSVFMQGLLLMTQGERPAFFDRWQPLWQQWQGWLQDEALTPLQACLRFALSRAEIDRVVVGVDSLEQLQATVNGAYGLALVPPDALMSEDPDLVNPSRWILRKTVAIVQARMGSTRFPNKVMRPVSGTPMIGLLLGRLSSALNVDQIVLATSKDSGNDALAEYVRTLGFGVYRGSENDVLDRYYHAAKEAGAETVVRVTGDCPLIDPELVDAVIARFRDSGADFVSNNEPPTFPDGLDVEVFSFRALELAWRDAQSTHEREHVTPYICETDRFTKLNVAAARDRSAERWTVDEPEDFEVVSQVYEHFHPRRDFGWREVLALCDAHPERFIANRHLMRNAGARLGVGQKLWRRAKRVIPGGNMLLSKRAEMFLPGRWPAYFSKAKDCRVWDLEGIEYLDMAVMGIGTNILGYGHPEVDDAVRETIAAGNMSTLNCPEEVYLAERLVELHPWAHMVRLARTGGEANAIAVRIARAASGRDRVAICGYHGWHDWYLAANLGDEENLAGHLLPGLEPRGVPQNLRGSVLPFRYNDFAQLEALVRDREVGVIKMEVSRNTGPEDGFLQKVRQLATDRNIVLIFDECTSGFRQAFGGLHKLYGVEPDMAMFGKALGNGYAITAVIGKRDIMEAAQSTFISSTFWTERIGPTAALKTLQVMEREKSWERITQTGRAIGERWQALARKYELPLQLSGLPALIGFTLPVADMLKYKTLITQEMLKKGILATAEVYVCTEHSQATVDRYFEALDPVFALIQQCEAGRSIDELLEGPVCHERFKRLN
jgi:glutamate-1-semialdehyde 2,1-aminomutase